MSIITDGLLIATCVTAALYCIVLSRRLARFSDTKSGIGQQIAQLNSILEETRANVRDSQSGAKSVSDRLARDLAGAKKSSKDLTALIERAEAAMDRALELQSAAPRASSSAVQQAPTAFAVDDAPFAADTEPAKPGAADATPIEELDHDDVAEQDFDLSDARGEPQLGFLPSVADSAAFDDLSVDSTPATRRDDSTDAERSKGEDDAENLLKVERMAL